jgi:hypothetical protein
MPDVVLAAPGDHRTAAKTTFAQQAALRFSTFSINVSKLEFHLFFLSMANASSTAR